MFCKMYSRKRWSLLFEAQVNSMVTSSLFIDTYQPLTFFSSYRRGDATHQKHVEYVPGLQRQQHFRSLSSPETASTQPAAPRSLSNNTVSRRTMQNCTTQIYAPRGVGLLDDAVRADVVVHDTVGKSGDVETHQCQSNGVHTHKNVAAQQIQTNMAGGVATQYNSNMSSSLGTYFDGAVSLDT